MLVLKATVIRKDFAYHFFYTIIIIKTINII